MRTCSSTLCTPGLSPLLSVLLHLITLAAQDSQLRLFPQGPLNHLDPLPVPQLGHCETVSWVVTGSRDCSRLLGLPPFIICHCLLEDSGVVSSRKGSLAALSCWSTCPMSVPSLVWGPAQTRLSWSLVSVPRLLVRPRPCSPRPFTPPQPWAKL